VSVQAREVKTLKEVHSNDAEDKQEETGNDDHIQNIWNSFE